ncbi:hypothetical protein Hanom_Chr17g01569331 [Helianthus anomalus]
MDFLKFVYAVLPYLTSGNNWVADLQRRRGDWCRESGSSRMWWWWWWWRHDEVVVVNGNMWWLGQDKVYVTFWFYLLNI